MHEYPKHDLAGTGHALESFFFKLIIEVLVRACKQSVP